MSMDQRETFEWLTDRSRRLEEVEKELAASREIGPCGKHSKTFTTWHEVLSDRDPVQTFPRCSLCLEQQAIRTTAQFDTWGHVFQGIEEPCGCENHRKLTAALAERDRRILLALKVAHQTIQEWSADERGYVRVHKDVILASVNAALYELRAPVPAEGAKPPRSSAEKESGGR